MNPVAGYSEATATNFNAAERLPAGGYVLRILDVREENYTWGDVIVLRFDIAEGEQTGFFKRQYDAMSDEYKKWKGTHRINIPTLKSGSEEDMKRYNRSLGFFKAQIEAVNKSNNINIDCSKEWSPNAMKNKLVGAVFGNKEWEYDGKTGWYTACDHLVAAADIREGNFSIPKDKPLKNNSAAQTSAGDMYSDFEESVGEQTVPF